MLEGLRARGLDILPPFIMDGTSRSVCPVLHLGDSVYRDTLYSITIRFRAFSENGTLYRRCGYGRQVITVYFLWPLLLQGTRYVGRVGTVFSFVSVDFSKISHTDGEKDVSVYMCLCVYVSGTCMCVYPFVLLFTSVLRGFLFQWKQRTGKGSSRPGPDEEDGGGTSGEE